MKRLVQITEIKEVVTFAHSTAKKVDLGISYEHALLECVALADVLETESLRHIDRKGRNNPDLFARKLLDKFNDFAQLHQTRANKGYNLELNHKQISASNLILEAVGYAHVLVTEHRATYYPKANNR